jgi:hypothetical protein
VTPPLDPRPRRFTLPELFYLVTLAGALGYFGYLVFTSIHV